MFLIVIAVCAFIFAFYFLRKAIARRKNNNSVKSRLYQPDVSFDSSTHYLNGSYANTGKSKAVVWVDWSK